MKDDGDDDDNGDEDHSDYTTLRKRRLTVQRCVTVCVCVCAH